MFRKILIANRGEIACRVIDTARRLGVLTVAVYSDADRASRHVAMADEAVAIGGLSSRESYLRGEVIIAAARATGAEAIHPGYGFLSENPDFVDQVEAAGLVFIGPSASSIRAMGLKDAAKQLMEKAGVPVVPGYHGANQDAEHLAAAADAIGYPVLIKAIAGGGGKGMRKVDEPSGFAAALTSAQGEAQAAFGNPAVLIEKYVDKPRHIEVQVFGDGRSAVHLYERDCSLQRRHQKVIEEAPAPGMTAQMRAAMGNAAVRAAEAIGYSGAGTIEFIVDASDGLRPDRFWFMEMNTRLQVEHPVTEAITGIDLVEWQLRVASGEPLPLRQEEIRLTGHAFEARLYAEDVPAGFLPATGRLAHLVFPPGVRAETGVRSGDEISPWYDPMIAKIIVHGPTRALALQKLRRALADTEVAGTVTNLAFLSALARHAGFTAGDVDTGLIASDLAGLTTEPEPDAAVLAMAAIAAAGLLDGAGPSAGFALWAPLRQTQRFGDHTAVIIPHGPGGFMVETALGAQTCRLSGGQWRTDGSPAPKAVCHQAGISVFSGYGFHFAWHDPFAQTVEDARGSGLTIAPMPGLVKDVHVSVGDSVKVGDHLVVLEAMKMEHTLSATVAGTVAELLVTAGDQVQSGAALIRLESGEG
jgi:3-methylcrotonyl-CoA carboxylase alpha subunit